MKIVRIVALLVTVALAAVACGSDATPIDGGGLGSEGETVRLFVGEDLVDCVGVAPRECLLVSETGHEGYEFFYDAIEGFEHVPGTRYVLDVEVSAVADPPADGSSVAYRLVEIVEQETRIDNGGLGSEDEDQDALDGTTWTLRAFGLDDEYVEALDGQLVTIEFKDGGMIAETGCNTVTAGYTIDGDELTFGELASTKAGCLSDELATQETAFNEALGQVTRFAVEDESLQLSQTDTTYLIFDIG